MKKALSLLSILVSFGIISGVFTGCGAKSEISPPPTSDSSQAVSTDDSAAKKSSYLIAENNWGQGVPILDLIENEARYAVTTLGSDFQAYNDEFSADKMKTNIQGMLSANTDGIMFFGAVPTLIPVVADMCEKSKVPFVIFDQIPLDENVIAQLEANPYYVGSVGTDNYAAGKNMAERALENGCKNALILGGAVGDPVHEQRINGFTAAFEQGGGKIAGIGRCDSPASGTTKCDDLIAASPDADCIYALTGDYATSALTALDNHSADMGVYATDSTSNTLESLKEGKIVVGDGGSTIAPTIAATLLINWLDGNQLKTSEGKAPYVNTIVSFPIYKESADDYQKYWLSGNPLTAEQLNALHKPETTLADIESFISNYSLETIVSGHK